MANLTITVDPDVLRKARVRALESGTSVNAILREYLESYSGGRIGRSEAVRSLLARSRRAKSGSGGARWNRDALHER